MTDLHPFKIFPPDLDGQFSPLNLSNLTRLWLDAADSSTITFGTGSSVYQWFDKSNNNNHVWQPTVINQPLYDYDSTYNKIGIKFTNGSGTFLVPQNTSRYPVDSLKNYSIFIVCRLSDPAISTAQTLIYTNTGTPTEFIRLSGGTLTVTNNEVSVTSSRTSATASGIYSIISGQSLLTHINGTSIGSTLRTSPVSHSLNYFIGTQSSSVGGMSGYIFEIIILNCSVSSVLQKKIEGYLANKWAMLLPSTHPYYKFSPSASLTYTIPSSVGSVTISSATTTGGTIVITPGAVLGTGYRWFVGTGLGTGIITSGIVSGSTTTITFTVSLTVSTNYYAWIIPYNYMIDSPLVYSPAKQIASSSITSANLNTIATYLRNFMSEFRNPSFYTYDLNGDSYFIADGGGDMYDSGNYTYPWLISGAQYTTATGSQQPFSINYSSTTATTVDTGFIYASLGYAQGTGVTSVFPLTVLGFRSTEGHPIGFQVSGNSGADGGGTLASGILYAGSTLSGFTVHAFYRETYAAGDPSHCNLFILLGHPNWGSVFGTINSFADPVVNGGNGAFFYTSGAAVKNILAIQTLLSKSGGALVTSAECQTVVQAFANRIKESLGF
jgi:hypothetical protein